MIVSEIHIIRELNPDGSDTIAVQTVPDDLPLIEILGMLELAKGYEAHTGVEEVDDAS